MAVVFCFLDHYFENITVCLCYSIKYKITEDVLHYGKHRYDKQATERHKTVLDVVMGTCTGPAKNVIS